MPSATAPATDALQHWCYLKIAHDRTGGRPVLRDPLAETVPFVTVAPNPLAEIVAVVTLAPNPMADIVLVVTLASRPEAEIVWVVTVAPRPLAEIVGVVVVVAAVAAAPCTRSDARKTTTKRPGFTAAWICTTVFALWDWRSISTDPRACSLSANRRGFCREVHIAKWRADTPFGTRSSPG